MARKPGVPRDSESKPDVPTADASIVDFNAPPVAEVVCGIAFSELPGYTSLQMGLFWERVRNEFPNVEPQTPLAPPGGSLEPRFVQIPPPPRFFLKSGDGGELIQLQDNRFLYNWVKKDEDHTYPRFRNVVQRFNGLRQKFEEFLITEELGPLSVNELRLTYVNHVFQGSGWKALSDIGKVFPDFKYRKRGQRYLLPPTAWNIVSFHPVRDPKSKLEVSIRSGTKYAGEPREQNLFVGQLTVTGDVSEPTNSEIQSWFNMAREAIDLSFLDLTSEKIQRDVWGLQEDG